MCKFNFRLLAGLLTFGIGVLSVYFGFVKFNHSDAPIKQTEQVEPEILGFNEVVSAKDGTYVTVQGFIDLKFLCQGKSDLQEYVCTTALIGSSLEHKNMHIKIQKCNEIVKSNCIQYNLPFANPYEVKIYDFYSNPVDFMEQQIKVTGSVSVVDGKGRFNNPIGKIESADTSQNKIIPLSEIDLSLIGHTAPKVRIQDLDYNQLPIVEQLIAHNKESIPFLISKLTDETKAKDQVIDFWNDVRVADVAFFILTDFFIDRSSEHSTIKGASFNEFLGCNDRNIPSDHCYYNYIEKHGRKHIKARWQKIWNDNKDKIFWDESERYFRVKT